MNKEGIISIIAKDKQLYLDLLDDITHNTDINYVYGKNIVEECMKNLKTAFNLGESAFYIEIIVRIIDCLTEDGDVNEYNIIKLYEEYCKELKNGYMNERKVTETLSLFADLQIDSTQILDDMLKILDESLVIKLFSNMNLDLFPNSINRYEDLLHKIILYKKKVRRFDLILHFYLLTNPNYVANIGIVGEYLKKYSNYSILCADWIFSQKTPNYKFVDEGIISKNEHEKFVKIGDILNECKTVSVLKDSCNTLEQDLIIISNNFRYKLNSKSVRNILKDFNYEKDFIKMACTLPKNNV